MAATDFQRQLGRQLQFIENSCKEYDLGCKDEAIRISTALRIIFHDTKSSTSLLSHLQCATLNMLSTSLNTKPNERHPLLLLCGKESRARRAVFIVPLCSMRPDQGGLSLAKSGGTRKSYSEASVWKLLDVNWCSMQRIQMEGHT
jgi:hypothetical protein